MAVKDYSIALNLDPDNARAYYSRALVYEKVGDQLKASEDYSKAAVLDPEFKNKK